MSERTKIDDVATKSYPVTFSLTEKAKDATTWRLMQAILTVSPHSVQLFLLRNVTFFAKTDSQTRTFKNLLQLIINHGKRRS
jgi:hypothetical protein